MDDSFRHGDKVLIEAEIWRKDAELPDCYEVIIKGAICFKHYEASYPLVIVKGEDIHAGRK